MIVMIVIITDYITVSNVFQRVLKLFTID